MPFISINIAHIIAVSLTKQELLVLSQHFLKDVEVARIVTKKGTSFLFSSFTTAQELQLPPNKPL